MAATVRSGGEAAAEEAEPRSRFPGLGPVVELLVGFRVGVWGAVCRWHTFGTGRIGPGPEGGRPQRGLGRSPKVWPL